MTLAPPSHETDTYVHLAFSDCSDGVARWLSVAPLPPAPIGLWELLEDLAGASCRAAERPKTKLDHKVRARSGERLLRAPIEESHRLNLTEMRRTPRLYEERYDA